MIKAKHILWGIACSSLALSMGGFVIAVNASVNTPREPTSEAYREARKSVARYIGNKTDDDIYYVRTIAEKETSAVWEFSLFQDYDIYPYGYVASADWSGEVIKTEVWKTL